MDSTISDLALDLGVFALDNELETGNPLVIHSAAQVYARRIGRAPRTSTMDG